MIFQPLGTRSCVKSRVYEILQGAEQREVDDGDCDIDVDVDVDWDESGGVEGSGKAINRTNKRIKFRK
ncbi:hypothetical protein RUM43_011802 [Polyplax serrata]|uniref:Uncharacterized protein n=1 Tax=Polyplax serrata TaxID=468196 RepID=A0AAN8NYT0_POLSC